MNELNARHLRLMTDLIQNFKLRKMRFDQFVNRLDELIVNMDNPPGDWHERIKSLWMNLEEINAVLLDESNKNQTIEHFQSKIADLINNLEEQIQKFH